MDNSTKAIVNNTASSSLYPRYLKNKFLKLAVSNNLLINNKLDNQNTTSLFSSMMPDVSSFENIDDKFIAALQDKNIQKYFEEFLFEKQYRFFTLFSIEGITLDSFKRLLDQKRAIPFTEFDGYSSEVINRDIPYIIEQEECILLKFWKILKDEDQNEIVYPMIILFDLKQNLVEIRFDTIGINYKHTYDFYKNIIAKLRDWIRQNLAGETHAIDFKAVIEYAKTEADGLNIYAQKMNRNKTSVYLEYLDDGEIVMPIIGELTKLIDSKEGLFSKNEETRAIEELLRRFISKIEVDSDIPQLKLRLDEIKIKIGITHQYKNTDYSLFQYYDDLTRDKEEMDYVRNFFAETYRNLNRASSSSSIPE